MTVCVFSCREEINVKKEPDIFPLDAGYIWTYKSTVQPSCCGLTYTVTSEGLSRFADQDAFAFHNTRAECRVEKCYFVITERTNLLVKREDGIYLIGTRFTQGGSVIYDIPAKIFEFPVAIGMSWESHSQGSLPPNAGKTISITIGCQLTVISKSETVITPAGEFKDCVQLKGIKYEWWYSNNLISGGEGYDTIAWYAPGIGLIKEIGRSRIYGWDYTVTYELVAYTAPPK